MTKDQAKKRIDKLVEQIDELRYRYHVLNDPTVTDEIYDSLEQELVELEKQFPDLKRVDSPLQRIGGKPLDKFKKVHHQVRQWSFNDAFDSEAVFDWEQRIKKILIKEVGQDVKLDYVCELKIDGLHVVLNYQKGILQQAATRGDGLIGEEVTQNIKTIQSIPLKLKKPLDVIVEGEVWLSEKQLETINQKRIKENQPPFANPRNAAAGTIRQLDSKIVAERKLDSFIYDWSGGSDQPPATQAEELESLKKIGFKVNQDYQVCGSIDEVLAFWQSWETKKKSQDYWIDGVVVKVNQRRFQEILGHVGKAPRWALAIKFAAEQVTTVIEDIQVQVGRLGTLTPVANLKPVKLAGTIVKRATLHNEDQIKRLDVRIGDTVVIRKAGEIIPEVVSVLPKMRNGKEKKFVMPKKCPVCGSAVEKKEITDQKNGESVAYFCTNKNCYAQTSRQIIHLVSKKAFDIDGLGGKIIEQLMAESLVKDQADIFSLKREDLLPLERFAEKSADNLIEAINQAKEITLGRFLYALGIQHVGEQTAIELAKKFGSLEKIKKATRQDFEAIEDIGPVVAKSVYQYFSQPKNLDLLNRIVGHGVRIKNYQPTVVGGKLAGKKLLVTGTLEKLSREQAKEAIRKAGGDWVSAVSKNLDYLVVGQNPGSKYQKAKSLGINIINEKEFLALVK
ncbi:MAG: NAD-dependent DNA ligase LigA [Candidatus Buchananbacteria bacterium]|nr:NAD-dependent DNA ligase LigA [Candidatus Buchananbacteria bacterium]